VKVIIQVVEADALDQGLVLAAKEVDFTFHADVPEAKARPGPLAAGSDAAIVGSWLRKSTISLISGLVARVASELILAPIILLPSTGLGGAELHALAVAAAFRERWPGTTLAAPDLPTLEPLRRRAARLGLPVLAAEIAWDPARSASSRTRQAQEVARLAQIVPFDLALVAVPWPRAGLGLLAGLGALDTPTIAVFHLAPERGEVAEAERRATGDARRLVPVAVSPHLRLRVAGLLGLPADRILVVPNGVAVPPPPGPDERRSARGRLRRELRLPAEAPLVLNVARFGPLKGHADLVTVAEFVAARRPDARFACLGDGPLLPAVRAALASRGLADRVLCPGWVEDPAGSTPPPTCSCCRRWARATRWP
jgi:glycosyltransferase involved in cell wall biosynthesis